MFQVIRLRLLSRSIAAAICVVVVTAPPLAKGGNGLAAVDAFHVGRYHLSSGNRAEALASFNDTVRMNPQFVQAYLARGKLLAEMGEYESALADLNFALQLQPTHAEGFAYRGYALLALHRPNDALPEFNAALRLDPSYARVHFLRSQTLRQLGDEAGAEASLARARRLDPSLGSVPVVTEVADGMIVESTVQFSGPAPLDRTSIMTSTVVPPPPPLAAKDRGRVVQFDRRPQDSRTPRFNFAQPGETGRGSASNLEKSAAGRPSSNRSATHHAAADRSDPKVPPAVEPTSHELDQPLAGKPSMQFVKPFHPQEHPDLKVPDIQLATSPSPEPVAPSPEPVAPSPEPVAASVSPATTMTPASEQDHGNAPASEIFSGNHFNSYLAKPDHELSNQRLNAALDAVKSIVPDSGTTTAAIEIDDRTSSALIADVASMAAAVASDDSATTGLLLPLHEEVSIAASPRESLPVTTTGEAADAVRSGLDAEEAGDLDAALAAYTRALESNPQDAATCCRRGHLHLLRSQPDAASADFNEAIRLAPGLAIGYFGRGHTHYLTHEYADAVDDFTIALRLDDQHAQALFERGHCHHLLGHSAEAQSDRLAALALDPSLATSGTQYGGARVEIDMSAAAVVSDDARATDSPAVQPVEAPLVETLPEPDAFVADDQPSSRVAKALVCCENARRLHDAGHMTEALDELDRAIKLDDRCQAAYLLRGRLHTLQGATEKAEADLRQARLLDSE